ncbi:MAG: transglycosylase SLT domain-containing protein [Kiloniellales bacterium]|nr:transglycosylase SLT domain-containing protein [Kiloniellales bacterium]
MTAVRSAVAWGLAAAIGLAGLGDPAAAATRAEVKRIVVEEALRAGFPPSLAMAVAKAESDFRDDAQDSEGARGVMQVPPGIAEKDYGVDPERLWEPRLNVQLGIDRLQNLIRRYDGRWEAALSHYGGGSGGDNPGTSAFVNEVLRLQRQYRAEARSWAGELRAGNGRLASIVAPYRREGKAWTASSAVSPRREEPGTMDDFEKAIEVRRRAARQHLDDFAPLVRRNDS